MMLWQGNIGWGNCRTNQERLLCPCEDCGSASVCLPRRELAGQWTCTLLQELAYAHMGTGDYDAAFKAINDARTVALQQGYNDRAVSPASSSESLLLFQLFPVAPLRKCSLMHAGHVCMHACSMRVTIA